MRQLPIILALALFACKREPPKTTSLNPALQQRLSTVKAFNDLFAEKRSISFQVADSIVLERPRNVVHVGDSAFAWVQYSLPLYVFDHQGNCTYRLRNVGRGPGEVLSVADLGVDGSGRIYVYDSKQLKISVFDKFFAFILSYPLKPGGFKKICVDNKGNVSTLLEGAYGNFRPAVRKYNRLGQVLEEWGEIPKTARVQDILLGGGIVADESNAVYYGYLSDHRIWVRSSDGVDKAFDDIPEYYRKADEGVASIDDTRKLVSESWKISRLIRLDVLSSGLLLQQFANGNPWSGEKVEYLLEVWDVSGTKWCTGLRCPGPIVMSHKNEVGLFFEDSDVAAELQSPRLVIYSILGNSQ
jgi:hypothetical protein